MRTDKQPLIASVGLITPLGDQATTTWEALLAGRHVTTHTRVPGVETDYRAEFLAEKAAREALAAARWTSQMLADEATGLVIGTSKGPILRWINPLLHMSKCTYDVAGGFGLSQVAGRLSARLRLGCGPRLTISTACASGLHALIRAAMMIRDGQAARVLVVAVESSVHPLFLGSFQRLGVLPPEGFGCRPMDQERAGFLMTEAAAAVCLNAGGPDDRGVLVERFALGSDATHLTAGDPHGRTLRRLLQSVVADGPVDLVHAHATGTVANDAMELAAIEAAIGELQPQPALYCHKGALGHSLGAAGLVGVAISCLAHRHGLVPPNVQTRMPLLATRVLISAAAEARPIRRSIAIAAGFGGAMGVVSLASRNLT